MSDKRFPVRLRIEGGPRAVAMNIELDGADGQKVRPIISGFDISAKAGELIEVKLHTWLNEGNIAAAISQDRIRESFDELLAAVGLKCVPLEDDE